MPNFEVPVRINVPAHGTVDIEAESFEDACTKVREDIAQNGFESRAAEADFTSDWSRQTDLAIDEAAFPKREQKLE